MNKISNFFKKNAFYIVLAVVLSVVAISGAFIIMGNDNKMDVVVKDGSSASVDAENSSGEGHSTNTPMVISVVMPVKNGVISKDYSEDIPVFNNTLGNYRVHLGVDVIGEEGAEVLCAYAGTVESVETSYLLGTVITVDHGNGLKTKYSSLEVDENITIGKVLKEGDRLGVISTENKEEYKDGAHLHFETELNGEKVDPTTYLIIEDNK